MLTKINVNLPHLLCSVVLATDNGVYRRFGGFAFDVYLRVIRERQGRKAFQNRSSVEPIFTPKIASPRLHTEHKAKLTCWGFVSYHSFENPSKIPSASRRIKRIWSSNHPGQIFVFRSQTVTPMLHSDWMRPTVTAWPFEDGTRKFASDDLNFICVLFGG